LRLFKSYRSFLDFLLSTCKRVSVLYFILAITTTGY
jgi:hypothetical protein